MALTVGELVAYIRADGTQFDRQVDQSGQKFQALGTIVSTGTKTIATAFTAVTAGATALGAHVFKIGADYNRLQQSSRAALSTLLGSAEAANAQMDKLDDFAKNSPFAKQVFIQAQQQLLGFGVEAGKVIPILDAVQNAVAAVGGSNEQVEQVTYALAQMQGQGKLTGETLNQLGQYGIDAAGIVGAEMGKTGAEIRELASKPGGIPVDQIWDPLVTGLMERFGGATDAIKLQYDGAVDRIKGATRDIGSIIAAPFIDPNGGGRAVEWANKVADALRALQTKVDPLVDVLVQRLTPAFDAITPALDQVKSAINGWDISQVNAQIDTLVEYAPLIAGVSAGLLALGGNSLGLGRLGLALNPVVAGIAALVATSPELRGVGQDFLRALEPVLPILSELGEVTADVAMELIRVLAPAIGDLAVPVAEVVVALASGLSPALITTLEALVPVAEVVGDVASVIANIPTPVLAAVAAFMAFKDVNIAPIVEGVGTAFGAMRDTVNASRAVLEATGQQAGVMNTAMMTARVGVTTLGTALKATFLTNPVGIAIAALSSALGVFAAKSAEAKARAETYADAVKLVGEEAEVATAKVAAAALVNGDDWGWWQKLSTDFDSAADAMEHLGISLSDASAKIAGSRADFDSYIEGLEAMKAQYPEHETAIQQIIVKSSQQRSAYEDAADSARQMEEATAGLTSETERATPAMDLYNDAIRENGELNLSAAEATLRAQDAQVRATEAIDAARAAQEEANRITQDANATEEEKAAAVKASEEATRNAESAILSNVSAHNSQIDAMRKNNASNQDLITTVMAARQSFIDQQVSMGKTREEANRLADEYGLIPSSVVTQVSITGNAYDVVSQIVQKVTDLNGKTFSFTMQMNARGEQVNGFGYNSRISEDGSLSERGNRLKAFADGGLTGAGAAVARVPQIQRGGANVLWAEDSTIWEAYISGKPDMRNRNLRIWEEAGRRLGAFPTAVQPYANGGITTPEVVTVTPQGNVTNVDVQVTTTGDERRVGRAVGEELAWRLRA
ncbi:tape measure protein [Cellulosimicrobium cellulans]|uniref:tape measure protein n=1 Tax=Cellulosimicrobium cellulans TaxID=1710 RepID=UPI0019669771|nr:tape measure protein [Cellulosimicrobium cellulans]MBN0040250.1 tape measure protein [Cellulosimicrobium cellulans]